MLGYGYGFDTRLICTCGLIALQMIGKNWSATWKPNMELE